MNTLKSKDGLKLELYNWLIENAKADIIFTHGFFEHAGRYANEAKFFNENGYNFIAYDQRTHGKSGGKYRSYIKSFNDYLDDYKLFLAHNKLGEKRPYYLFAHSMGGLVQCSHLLNNDPPANFKGAIFSAPFLKPDRNTAPILQKVAGIVAALAPRLRVLDLDPTTISRDPDEIEKYINDPLIYSDKMYACSGAQMLKQMNKIKPLFKTFDWPFIILHGSDDKLAELEGSKLLYNESKSTDKSLEILKDSKHEITKDLDKAKVLNLILTWMNKRI